jgi:hypothetical protein
MRISEYEGLETPDFASLLNDTNIYHSIESDSLGADIYYNQTTRNIKYVEIDD